MNNITAKHILYSLLLAGVALLGVYFLPTGNTFQITVETPTSIASSPMITGVSGDFLWAKRMGGSGTGDFGQGYDIATDLDGNIYFTGGFTGELDFDPGEGTFTLASASLDYSDIFAAKLDSEGNFLWARHIGGQAWDYAYDIAVDSNRDVYVMGSFEGTADFDPGPDILNLSSAGLRDIFVVRLDENGNLIWAKRMGGASDDGGSAVAVDHDGNVYLTGYFQGTADFDPGENTVNLKSAGKNDIVVTKLDADGNLIWAKRMGGIQNDLGFGLALGADSVVYTTGRFEGAVDFDPGAETTNFVSIGGSDAFLSKLDADGNFVWAGVVGGNGEAQGFGLVVDSGGSVYLTGDFWRKVDFDPGEKSFDLTSFGDSDVFLCKLDENGNFVWAKQMGGPGAGHGYDLALDPSGNIYTVGSFSDTADFDPGAGEFHLAGNGRYEDIFIAQLDADGNFIWAKSAGGAGDDLGVGIAVDPRGDVVATGNFAGKVDFDPGPEPFYLASQGYYDVFVSKLNGNGIPIFADVGDDHPQFKYIQALYASGLTSGCEVNPLKFCPDAVLNRAQTAVFMLRGQFGPAYTPPPAPWDVFSTEDWSGFEWARPWAEGMYAAELTKGCQADPLKFCPTAQLTRMEASIFGLKMKYGQSYLPPPATGDLFADLPAIGPNEWGIAWAEQAYRSGLLPSCGIQNGKPMFCPDEPVHRALAAYIIVKARNLPIP